MFCEQCGKEIADNSKFCSGCGAKTAPVESVEPINEPESAPEVEQAAEPESAPGVEQTAEPAPPPKTEQVSPPLPPVQPIPSPTYNAGYNAKDNLIKPLSIGAYIGMFILLCIPIVNLIMLLVWSFSDTVNINKKHFAIAQLIMILIGILLSICLAIVMIRMGWGWYNWRFNF